MRYRSPSRCSHCYRTGHNRRTCPDITRRIDAAESSGTHDYFAEHAKKARARGRVRSCGYCHNTGHNRRSCPKKKTDISNSIRKEIILRNEIVAMIERGDLAPGVLIQNNDYSWRFNSPFFILTSLDWNELRTVDGTYRSGLMVTSTGGGSLRAPLPEIDDPADALAPAIFCGNSSTKILSAGTSFAFPIPDDFLNSDNIRLAVEKAYN